MTAFVAAAKKFLVAQEGATMVEYGVMIALICAVVVGTVAAIGKRTSNAFTKVDNALSVNGVT